MARTTTPPPSLRTGRRRLAAAGLLVPGLAFTIVSAYVLLCFGGGCCTCTPAHSGGCAADTAGVAVVTFPAAVVCVVLAAALLRGARLTRWASVIVGAVLATMTAAGALAGAMAMGGDGSDVRGAFGVGIVGVVLAAFCVLPAALLTGERGAECFPPAPDEHDEPDEPDEAEES